MLIQDIERLYKIKKDDRPDEFKNFLDRWESALSLNDIPGILSLYYAEAKEPIQNEYVSKMLNSIFIKMPDEADRIIGENYGHILHKESAWDCIPMVIDVLDKTNTRQEYLERLYKIKALNRPDEFARIDDKWPNGFTAEDIPSLMRLYYSEAETLAQNEYVTCIIDEVIEKMPEKAIKKIIENYDILRQEDSEGAILYIICMLVWWNREYIPITVKNLKVASTDTQIKIVSEVTKSVDRSSNLEIKENGDLFLSLYNKELPRN